MSTTAPALAVVAGFTVAELDHLTAQARANRPEVVVEAFSSDLAEEVAYTGQRFGMTS